MARLERVPTNWGYVLHPFYANETDHGSAQYVNRSFALGSLAEWPRMGVIQASVLGGVSLPDTAGHVLKDAAWTTTANVLGGGTSKAAGAIAEMKADSRHIGTDRPIFIQYTNGTYDFHSPNSGHFPDESFSRSHVNQSKYVMDAGGFGTFLHDPHSPSWFDEKLEELKTGVEVGCEGFMWDNSGWTAVSDKGLEVDADGVHTAPPDSEAANPYAKHLGRAYAKDEWMQAMNWLVLKLRARLYADGYGNPIAFVNGPNSGSRWFATPYPTSQLLPCADVLFFESWLRDGSNPATGWRSETSWAQDLNGVFETAHAGKCSYCTIKAWNVVTPDVVGTPGTVSHWERYAVASAMLVANGSHHFGFSIDNDRRTATDHNHGEVWPDGWELLDLGTPTTSATGSPPLVSSLKTFTGSFGNVYGRRFRNGIALIHPGTATEITGISLGGSYAAPVAKYHPDGITTPITTISLKTHEAFIGASGMSTYGIGTYGSGTYGAVVAPVAPVAPSPRRRPKRKSA